MNSFYDFTIKDQNQMELSLSTFKGKVILVVNVASQCGYTPQYKGLEDLYQKFKDKNFVILAFPCNQFGFQEPGTDDDIQSFCKLNYGVSFPVFSKIDVNGSKATPLYQFLKKQAPGILGTQAIKWNFTKFLIDANGNVVERFASTMEPKNIEPVISSLLKK